ncbi:hypothetical protein [Bradyrhizobium japonicum]|uniref:hypothetical protein n=1 Tax=Bradyrhizobium japonicum TaxID=375 RepID=UPI001BA6134A|nr:hypothetical protein [Bradyrhizobium japonicum]MBR0958904.1 hypothetical protein [Bradyrhizobium japonicum]
MTEEEVVLGDGDAEHRHDDRGFARKNPALSREALLLTALGFQRLAVSIRVT